MNAELEMPEGAEIAPKERIDAGAGAAWSRGADVTAQPMAAVDGCRRLSLTPRLSGASYGLSRERRCALGRSAARALSIAHS